MQRLTATVSTFAFLLWILPLGVFIAPSKEKILCGGQRAICMCSHGGHHKHSLPATGYSFEKSDDQKEEGSGFASSTHYEAAVQLRDPGLAASRHGSDPQTLRQLLVLRPVEHVPKV
jgi:hypothetical protein